MHIPVLLHEVIEALAPQAGETFCDGTFGGGGHSAEIMRRIAPNGTLVCIDRDESLLEKGIPRLHDFAENLNVTLHSLSGNYADMQTLLESKGIKSVSGILLDLGFSSFHVDSKERGFSFQNDGPLDMRYDRKSGITAEEVVNSFAGPALTEIFREYGDESRARQIAERIVFSRKKERIVTTLALAEVVESVKGKWKERGLHPATKVFQALRIYVNDELGSLSKFLETFPKLVSSEGRVAIISFHGLEDGLVKRRFRELSKSGQGMLLTKKPIVPTREEISANPRARSAKLRIIKFI